MNLFDAKEFLTLLMVDFHHYVKTVFSCFKRIIEKYLSLKQVMFLTLEEMERNQMSPSFQIATFSQLIKSICFETFHIFTFLLLVFSKNLN